jgi:hypothetical protein
MLLILGLSAATILAPSQVPALDPLVDVSPPIVTAEDGGTTVQYSVINRATRPITAWHVNFTLVLSNGKVVTGGQAKDDYEAYALRKESAAVVYPGQSVTSRLTFAEIDGAGGVVVTRATATLWYAIFADGTWLGDAADVKQTFKQRQADADALALIAGALRAGFAAGSGHTASQVALHRLNSAEVADADNVLIRVARKNLQRILDHTRSEQVEIADENLRILLLASEEQWEAADKHRRANPVGSGR